MISHVFYWCLLSSSATVGGLSLPLPPRQRSIALQPLEYGLAGIGRPGGGLICGGNTKYLSVVEASPL
jgi:hypothetical protein